VIVTALTASMIILLAQMRLVTQLDSAVQKTAGHMNARLKGRLSRRNYGSHNFHQVDSATAAGAIASPTASPIAARVESSGSPIVWNETNHSCTTSIGELPLSTTGTGGDSSLDKVQQAMNKLFEGFDQHHSPSKLERQEIVAAASKVKRNKTEGDTKCGEDTYGEVTVDGMNTLLQGIWKAEREEHAKQVSGNKGVLPSLQGRFLDLGSGVGKAVLLAALLGHIPETVGVEIGSKRYSDGCRAFQRLTEQLHTVIQSGGTQGAPYALDLHRALISAGGAAAAAGGIKNTTGSLRLTLELGDIMVTDLRNATFVYMASVCFRQAMMDALLDRFCEASPVGAKVASLRPFNEDMSLGGKAYRCPRLAGTPSSAPDREVVKWRTEMVRFTWGPTFVHVYLVRERAAGQ